MRVYKFTQKEVLNLIRTKGTIKLSSAETIRLNEQGKEKDGKGGYGDDLELATKWTPGPRSELITADHPFIKRGGFTLKRPITLTFEAGTHLVFGGSGHLFCTSISRSDEVVQGMRENFGYDASFAIDDVEAFGRAVCRALRRSEYSSDIVTYQDFDETSLDTFDKTAFHKPTRFSWQKEHRLVFDGNGPDAIIRVPGMWRFISSIQYH